MPDGLLFVCPALLDEVRAVLPDDAKADVRAMDLDVRAGESGERDASLRTIPEGLTDVSQCTGVSSPGCRRCAEALLLPDAYRALRADAVVVTPGWLRRWSAAGEPAPVVAPDGDDGQVVLLDTGVGHSMVPELERYSRAARRSAVRVEAGVEALRLRVALAITRWQLDRERDASRRARGAASAHMLALEVFGQIANLSSEDAVIEGLSELFTTLFGPHQLRYTPVAPMAVPPEMPARPLRKPPVDSGGAVTWQGPDAWMETADGFIVRVEQGGHELGRFELSGFAHPEAMPDYINLALSIARVAGVALANARAMHGIVPICAYCKKIRDDKGGWWKLETYLMRHSDARFSHGICPTCHAEQMKEAGLSPKP